MDPLIVMLVGMAVVFMGLVVLIGVVKLISLICNAAFGGKKADNTVKNAAPVVKPAAADSELAGIERQQLIAAISASIAETMGRPVAGIRIKSIKKLG